MGVWGLRHPPLPVGPQPVLSLGPWPALPAPALHLPGCPHLVPSPVSSHMPSTLGPGSLSFPLSPENPLSSRSAAPFPLKFRGWGAPREEAASDSLSSSQPQHRRPPPRRFWKSGEPEGPVDAGSRRVALGPCATSWPFCGGSGETLLSQELLLHTGLLPPRGPPAPSPPHQTPRPFLLPEQAWPSGVTQGSRVVANQMALKHPPQASDLTREPQGPQGWGAPQSDGGPAQEPARRSPPPPRASHIPGGSASSPVSPICSWLT